VLRISASSENPKEATNLANAVTDSYMKLAVDVALRERFERLHHLTGLWDDYQRTIKQKRETLRTLARRAGSDDKHLLVAKSQLDSQQLAILQQEKLRVKAELIRLRAEQKALAEQAAGPGTSDTLTGAALADAIEKDPEIRLLRDYVAVLRQRLDEARKDAGTDGEADAELIRQASEAEDLLRKARNGFLEQRLAALDPGQAGSLRVANEIRALEAFGASLEKEAEDLQARLKEDNETTLDLEDQKAQIALLDEMAKRVGIEKEAMKVEIEASPRITIIDRAKLPASPESDMNFQAAIFAGSLATLLILCGAYVRGEVRARTRAQAG
jgi:hypothetical protein